MNQEELFEILNINKIQYKIIEHPAVFTCDDADKYTGNHPGIGTKNLFLSNKKSNQFYLLMTRSDTKIDFKSLSILLNQKNIKFASIENTKKHLDVEPGSVSVFCALNNQSPNIEILIDEDLYQFDLIQSHPLTNKATIIVGIKDIENLLTNSKIRFRIMPIPIKI